MLLKDIISELETISIKGPTNIEISDIAYDSRKTKKNSLFVCIDGYKVDGHKFISYALENGVTAILVQKDVDVPNGITVIKVSDTRHALAFVADAFYMHPSRKFKLVGVTGTKGKTTITYMIKSILDAEKQKVGLIGTISNQIGDEVLHTERTTPESYDLQSLFSEMVDKEVDTVVMEVSSHALELHRVGCSDFDIGIFTNLSRAHLDFHETFENYLNAKIKLFNMCKKGLVNIDSEYGEQVFDRAECELYTYGIEKDADIKAYDIIKYPDRIEFNLVTNWINGSNGTPWTNGSNGTPWLQSKDSIGNNQSIHSENVVVSIPGIFNVYNALAAIGACSLLGISFESIKKGLRKVSVPGRVEVVDVGKDYTIIIDYAHTPDSLENILSTVKGYAPERVVCLFGCGGDRDKTMRPFMGEISGKIADFTIITSDNPRTEDPEAIVNQIEEGMKKTEGKYIKIIDRREAIKYAFLKYKTYILSMLSSI